MKIQSVGKTLPSSYLRSPGKEHTLGVRRAWACAAAGTVASGVTSAKHVASLRLGPHPDGQHRGSQLGLLPLGCSQEVPTGKT